MNTQPLDSIPLWILVLFVAPILIAALEVGHRLGLWRHQRHPGEKEMSVGAFSAALSV